MAKGKSGVEKKQAGEVKTTAPVVMMIRKEDLELGPNVRGKVSDEKRKRFAENIRANRIDTPLTVEPYSRPGKGPKYVIRDGACRFLGGQDAGLKEFPCQVKEVGDVTTFQLRTTFREDFGAVEEAKAFQEQLKNKTLADLVLQTGKEKAYIEKRLLLLNLEVEMQQAITDGKISASHGYVLAQVGDENLRKEYFQETIKKKLSVADILSDIKNSREKSIKLDLAGFDRKECGACPFSGIKTLSLFESTDTFNGECTNPACFLKKQAPILEKTIQNNHPRAKVIIRKELHVGSYGLEREIKELKNSNEFPGYDYRKLPDGCEKCEKLIIVSGLDGDAKKFCTDPGCYKKKTQRRGSSGAGEKLDNARAKELAKSKTENRVKETRNRFLISTVAAATRNSINHALIVGIDSIVHELGFSDKDAAPYLAKTGLLPEKKKNTENGHIWQLLPQILAKANRADLEKALIHFAAVWVERNMGYEFTNLAALAAMGSHQVSDFRVDEQYLERMMKDDLVELAKEWNLEIPKDLQKKGEMVAWLLKNAPDKCPAEIVDLKKRPLGSKYDTFNPGSPEDDEEE